MNAETLKDLLTHATPGTWERSKENEVCNQIDGEYHAICTDQFCYAPEDEQEANARLIALAPQLAADNIALQAEVERLREALEDIATGDGVYGAQAHEYKTLARAALNT